MPFLNSENPFIGLKNLNVTNPFQESIVYVEMPEGKDINIGRLDSNNMIIPDDNSVSRLHGLLKLKNNSVKIFDRSSKFGTLVY